MKLKSVRVVRFKRVSDATFAVENVNVLVGGNNSGKSTIIQAAHFGIGLLQTIQASGIKWPQSGSKPTSLNPTDIIYSPSEDVYALGPGGRLSSDKDLGPQIEYTLSSGETCAVSFFKGKNRNIAVNVTNAPVAQKLARLDRPFSVFSPGLAGVAKREAYVSDGVLFRSLARGDANLVLRNILLRLWPTATSDKDQQHRWSNFLSELREVFPTIDLRVAFDAALDEHTTVSITTDGKHWVPLEIVGTGVLQATQILSYIHRFQPSLMVLDEPDSHLHPDNQRLLCGLLRRVTADRETQVVLTTHSRHVIDAIGSSANLLWVREGGISVASQDDELGILMEIGALDIRERIAGSTTSTVVLTEDDDASLLKTVLNASGFVMTDTVVQSYFGVTSPHNLRPLVAMIQKIKPNASIIVHRDRDFLNEAECSEWEVQIRKLNAEPFLTNGRDLESHFLNPKHLALLNPGVSEGQFEKLLSEVLKEQHDALVSDYVNGRTNAARQAKTSGNLNAGKLAVEAQKAVTENPQAYAGKPIVKRMREAFKDNHQTTLKLNKVTPALHSAKLAVILKQLKKPQIQA